MLGAERPEPAGGARRGRDGGLRAGGVDRLEPRGDQLLADRLRVDLGEEVLDLTVGRRGDALEDRVGVVVAGLDALEVEDGESAEPGELAGEPRHRPPRPSPTRGSGRPARCRRTSGPGRRRPVRSCRCRARARRPRTRRSGRMVSTLDRKTRRAAGVPSGQSRSGRSTSRTPPARGRSLSRRHPTVARRSRRGATVLARWPSSGQLEPGGPVGSTRSSRMRSMAVR